MITYSSPLTGTPTNGCTSDPEVLQDHQLRKDEVTEDDRPGDDAKKGGLRAVLRNRESGAQGGIKGGIFFPKEGFLCVDCEYEGPCREWKDN